MNLTLYTPTATGVALLSWHGSTSCYFASARLFFIEYELRWAGGRVITHLVRVMDGHSKPTMPLLALYFQLTSTPSSHASYFATTAPLRISLETGHER